MIVEVGNSCIFRDYVYNVPIYHPVTADRYRTEDQKQLDEYQDALIPERFKRCRPLDLPTKQFVKLGWDKRTFNGFMSTRTIVWLEPTEYTAAKEKKQILDITITVADNGEEILRLQINRALRGELWSK